MRKASGRAVRVKMLASTSIGGDEEAVVVEGIEEEEVEGKDEAVVVGGEEDEDGFDESVEED